MNPIYNKALEIMKHYYHVVYPYVGGDFMTGMESPIIKFNNAKRESLFLVQNILDALPSNSPEIYEFYGLADVINELEYNDHLIRCFET